MRLDDIWKRPADAAEEFDRTMVLRIAQVGAVAIAIESVEQWHANVRREAATLNGEGSDRPAIVEYLRLIDQEAYLRAGDGSEWILSVGLFDHDMHGAGPGDNRFLRRLHALMVEHRALMGDRRDAGPHYGPGLETMVLRRDTLDYRHAFCTTCGAWRDLQADAEEADRTLSPWLDVDDGC